MKTYRYDANIVVSFDDAREDIQETELTPEQIIAAIQDGGFILVDLIRALKVNELDNDELLTYVMEKRDEEGQLSNSIRGLLNRRGLMPQYIIKWFNERRTIRQGDRAMFYSILRNQSFDGEVISAGNFGSPEKDNWYIELKDDRTGYIYWKQYDDGGSLLGHTPKVTE